jgi:HAE1 family hydrophobic/amphiphilic exporter-1
MPTAYLPDEDQGILLAQVMLPTGSTLEQTRKLIDQVQRHFLENEKEAVESTMAVCGISFSGRAQNNAMSFIKLKDWKLRDREDLRVKAVAGRAMAAFSKIRNARVFAFAPPAVLELGTARGFDFQLQDRGGLGHEALMAARNQLLGMAAQDPRLTAVRPNGMEDVPEYRVDVDWEKAGALGIPITSIHHTLAAAFGSAYVNDFIQRGRVKRVYVQADTPYRMAAEDLGRLYTRNTAGKMVPYSAVASGRWTTASPRLERYNAFPSLSIQGEPAPGKSSGDAMRAMEEIAAKLPRGVGFDWTGLSYQERMASSQAPLLYAFSFVVIFLCLAALYESWTVPISILLVLPLGVIGGILASSFRGLPNDVYFQIGLLTTLGLTTKNAILIVQYAMNKLQEGTGLIEATLEGAKLRFRPIVMTSLAFGFGVLPLVLTTGAGAGAQNAIGTSVLGGMVTGTFLAVFFIPLFYFMIYRLMERTRNGQVKAAQPTEAGSPEGH